MLKTTVNGASRELADDTTLRGLLRELDLEPDLVAVEHNGEIIERAELDRVVLHEGDQIEIVRFMGGG